MVQERWEEVWQIVVARDLYLRNLHQYLESQSVI